MLPLPRIKVERSESCVIPSIHVPYPLSFYRQEVLLEEGLRSLKVVEEEIIHLVKRYIVLFPDVIRTLDEGAQYSYQCLVHDEETGITRGLLERLGYELEESIFTPYSLYWITLKTKTEKRKQKK